MRSDRLHRLPRRALALALVIAGLAVLAASRDVHSLLLRVLAPAERIITGHPVWGAVLFVLLAAVSAMLAFFSSAVIVPVGVYVWGEAASMALLWVGWILGGACTYCIGRFLGRPVAAALSSSATLTRYEERISERTPFWLVLLFQLALPSEVPGYVLGLARYPFGRYAAALALAELPYAVGTIYLGESFLEQRFLLFAALGAAGVLFSLWAFHTLHERLAG